MNNLTKEQMLELARIVYQDAIITEISGKIWIMTAAGDFKFGPDLDGSPGFRLQALDVMMAAFNLPQTSEISKRQSGWQFLFQDPYFDNVRNGQDLCPDILTAASLALISGGRS